MKLSYFAGTGSLYIDLSEEPSVDIDEASKRVQMDKLVLGQLPSTVETAAA